MNQPPTRIARTGSGRIQWELGWLAGTIGGVSWLAVGSIVLAWNGHTFESAVSASSWFFIVGLAYWLWRRRDRVDPFDAIVVVLIAFSVVMPIVWFTCWDIPTDARVPSLYWIRALRSAAACTMAPLILLCLVISERLMSPKTKHCVNSTRNCR